MTKGVRILSVVLLVLGIAFVLWGMDESHTLTNRVMKHVGGKYSSDVKWHVMSGVVMIAIGLGLLAGSFFKRKR
jgi:hypothetical protein